MQTIDLKRILTASNLKVSHVAPYIFPDNRDPANAMRRAIRGEMLLNSDQIARLSELLNVPIGLLFYDVSYWGAEANTNRSDIINFRADGYFAELNLSTMTTTLSKNGLLFFEKIITHDKSIGLRDYLSQLTDLIIKHK